MPQVQITADQFSRAKKSAKYVGVGLLAVILALGSFTTVPEGSRGVRLTFSEATGTTGAGLQFKIPFFQSVVPISVMADAVEVKNAEGATKDTQPVHTSLVVRYHINEKHVLGVYKDYSKEGNLDSYVATATAESFKAVTAKYDATELISKRQDVSTAVANAIQTKVAKYGVEVLNIDMTQFSFSPDYMKAINAKVTEEQQKLAEENKLARIQVEEQQKVVKAKAAADAAVMTAKGEAEATVTNAKAKAEATRLEAAALAANGQILELRKIEVQKIQAERWDGSLPSTVMGNAVPMINLSK